ncbi:MAG: hypothetical protein WD993_11100 [Thermoleophilaceae bacterium]
MLFDLQGKRRRVVQATYLTLAVLMGGGLVLFGVGGEVSGGLLDAFNGGGGGNGNQIVEDRVERNEERVQARPRAEAPRKELVRDYYALAVGQTEGTVFSEDAQDELRRASTHWGSYLEIEDGKPDPSLARVALQIYDPAALNQPQQALRAARIVAEEGDDVSSYLLLVQYALQAGDKRTQKLAEQKAVELAPERQRAAVRKQVKRLAAAAVAQQLQSADVQTAPAGGGGGGGGAGGGGGGGK